jgi:ATP-dependent DNA ligase
LFEIFRKQAKCPPLPKCGGLLICEFPELPKRIEMPGFIKPQLATPKTKAPTGEQWLHEIKYDGYRVQVHLNRGRKKVFTRNGLDWTKRFTEIAGAFAIPGEAIIDGEVVVVHEGRTNFSELQAELAAGRVGSFTTRSTSSGGMAISANSLRSNANSSC